MMASLSRRALLGAGAAVAAVHLLLVALLPRLPIEGDSLSYDAIALSLTRGEPWLRDGQAQVSWMPGYSTFVGALYLLVGHRPGLVLAAQALLVGLDAVLMYVLARRLLEPRRAGWALLWVALTPVLVAYQGILASENLALPLVLGLLEALTRPVPDSPRGQMHWALWAGFVGGALCFTRADYSLWMVAVPVILARSLPWPRVVALTAAAATVTALWLAPWVVRNARYHGELIPFTTVGGRTFWLSAQQPEQTEYGAPDFEAASQRCSDEAPRSPAAHDACMSRDAKRIAGSHPAYFAQRIPVRVARTLVSSHTDYLPGLQLSFGQARAQGRHGALAFKAVMLLAHLLLAVLAFVGFVRQRRVFLWGVLGVLLATKLAIHGVIFGTGRYGVPLLPLLLLGALAAFPSCVVRPRDTALPMTLAPSTLERMVPERVDPHDVAAREALTLHLSRYDFASHHVQPGGRLLDAACGVGYGTDLLARRHPDVHAVGLDIDEASIAHARQHHAGPRTEFVLADALRYQPAEPFTTIVSLETIEHLPDPAAFVARLVSLLAPGGVIVGSVPSTPSVDANPYHLHDFTERSFRSLFTRHGLREIDCLRQVQPFEPFPLLTRRQARSHDLRKNLPRYYLTHPASLLRRLVATARYGFENRYVTAAFRRD